MPMARLQVKPCQTSNSHSEDEVTDISWQQGKHQTYSVRALDLGCGPAQDHFLLLDRVPSKAIPWLERHWLDPQEVRRVQSYFHESKWYYIILPFPHGHSQNTFDAKRKYRAPWFQVSGRKQLPELAPPHTSSDLWHKHMPCTHRPLRCDFQWQEDKNSPHYYSWMHPKRSPEGQVNSAALQDTLWYPQTHSYPMTGSERGGRKRKQK